MKGATPSITKPAGVPGGIRTPDRRLSIPLWLSPPTNVVCGLDYIFTISGAARIVSTEPHDNHVQHSHVAPNYSSEFLPSSRSNQLEPLKLLNLLLFYMVHHATSKGDRKFPRYYHQHDLLRLHRYSAVHSIGFCFPIEAPY